MGALRKIFLSEKKPEITPFKRQTFHPLCATQVQQLKLFRYNSCITVITHLLLSGFWPVGYNDVDFFDKIFQTGDKCKMGF
jgi:hypothetical protein